MRKLVDDWNDDSALNSFDFKDKDVAIVILVNNAKVMIPIGDAPEHRISLSLWQVAKYFVYLLDVLYLVNGSYFLRWLLGHA